MDRPAIFLVLLCGLTMPAGGAAAQGPWFLSLYGGPTSDTFASQMADGHFHITGGMAGLAMTRDLANLGGGFSLTAEGQATQYFTHTAYQTLALGLGVSFNRFPWATPTTIALRLGPSYAFNPPSVDGDRHPLLNYVSAEYTMRIPHTDNWDWALRLYHRSGAWGVFAKNCDSGTMVGLGLRVRL